MLTRIHKFSIAVVVKREERLILRILLGSIPGKKLLKAAENLARFANLEQNNQPNLALFQTAPVCSIANRANPIFYGNYLWQIIGLWLGVDRLFLVWGNCGRVLRPYCPVKCVGDCL